MWTFRVQMPQCCLFIGRKTNNTKYSKGTFNTDGPIPLLTPKNDTQLRMDQNTHKKHTHLHECTRLISQCRHAQVNTNTTWCRSVNQTSTDRMSSVQQRGRGRLEFPSDTHCRFESLYKAPWNEHTHTRAHTYTHTAVVSNAIIAPKFKKKSNTKQRDPY